LLPCCRLNPGKAQPVLHLVRGFGDNANTGVPGLDEDSRGRRSCAVLVRSDGGQTGARVEAVHQDRLNRRHHFHRPVFNEVRGDHQKPIHLMIMERGQRLALVITIIGCLHEDQ
jgi:hypothetical protein